MQPLLIAGLSVGALGTIFSLIGFATNSWVTLSTFSAGLMNVCFKSKCTAYSADGSLGASKAFAGLAVTTSVIATIIALVYFFAFVRKNTEKPILPLLTTIFYFISAACSFLAFTIFAGSGKKTIDDTFKIKSDLGYSFVLVILAFLLQGAAGVLVFLHRRRTAQLSA